MATKNDRKTAVCACGNPMRRESNMCLDCWRDRSRQTVADARKKRWPQSKHTEEQGELQRYIEKHQAILCKSPAWQRYQEAITDSEGEVIQGRWEWKLEQAKKALDCEKEGQ